MSGTQNPRKIEWRKTCPWGLTASQFGMALGLNGRVSDFVTYLREYVDTELEFTGSEATQHGIYTEPKSRGCYELATGCRVGEGSFFLTEDRLLGCSPDGIVFDDKIGSSSSTPVRLLEIKSPFRSLYDGSRDSNKPFGIPKSYMCQMQGQMSIAGASECDFFVMHHDQNCQVSCWRVQHSKEFWNWCEPKLHLIISWIKDGLPEGVGREFEFDSFNYAKINVTPIIFPFNISLNQIIRCAARFKFFLEREQEFPSHCQVSLRLRAEVARVIFGGARYATPIGGLVQLAPENGQITTGVLTKIDWDHGFIIVCTQDGRHLQLHFAGEEIMQLKFAESNGTSPFFTPPVRVVCKRLSESSTPNSLDSENTNQPQRKKLKKTLIASRAVQKQVSISLI